MKRKKSAFLESLSSVPYGRRHLKTGAWPNSDIIMFDVDVTTCAALFLTNTLHIKPFDKKSLSQTSQESLVLLQCKYKSYQSLVKKYDIIFTVEKYQFYSHLICI